MYWCAPMTFLGNRSGTYDGFLEFDAYQSTTAYQDHGGSVILTGSGLSLYYDTAYNPATSWTFYRVSLNEVWWRKGAFGGPAATQLDLLKVLSTLDSLKIRAEFSSANDTDRLDNVRLLAPACTPAAILTMRPPEGGYVAIEWPANACGFALESRLHLAGAGWSGTGLPVVLTNELNRVAVPLTNAAGFYRLTKP